MASSDRQAPRRALRVTVYDPEGNALSVRPIDAQELIASGHYSGDTLKPDHIEKPELEPVDKGAATPTPWVAAEAPKPNTVAPRESGKGRGRK